MEAENQQDFSQDGAFFNPAMAFNRDITIAVINEFASQQTSKLSILEALGATGLRSVRFAKEIDAKKVHKIVCNDMCESAVENIGKNVTKHGVGNIVEPSHSDAITLMQKHRISYDDRKKCNLKNLKRNGVKIEDLGETAEIKEQKVDKDGKVTEDKFLASETNFIPGFDVIDLDPYGTVVPFLDSAIQAVRNGGLLCLTCTDMAVLSGAHIHTCWSSYNTWPVRTGHRKTCHEQALRTLLHSVDSTAAKYGRSIVPLISVSVDYYIRVFVQVKIDKQLAMESCTKNGLISMCKACYAWKTKPFAKKISQGKFRDSNSDFSDSCNFCQGNMAMGGPYYVNSIQNSEFAGKVAKFVQNSNMKASGRIYGFLRCISREIDSVLHWNISAMSSVMKMTSTIAMKIVRATLIKHGYKVSYVHSSSDSFKTDAPDAFVLKMFLAFDLQQDAGRIEIPEKKIGKPEYALRKKVIEQWKSDGDAIEKYVFEKTVLAEVKDTEFYELNELNIWEVSHHAPGMLPGKKRAGMETAAEKSKVLQNKHNKKQKRQRTMKGYVHRDGEKDKNGEKETNVPVKNDVEK